MKRLRDERGLTLIELLVTAGLMIVILGATLTVLDQFTALAGKGERQNDAQDRARHAVDLMARGLRNVTGPRGTPQTVEKAAPYDVVFQTVDPDSPGGTQNAARLSRVRYCLDSSRPDSGRIWSQAQTWSTATAPALPSTASCPDPTWRRSAVVADHVTNRRGGLDRPLWSYDADALDDIASVRLAVYVDVSPAADPPETRLASAVFIRNQNRRPLAAFTATVVGTRHIILNGSASEDPEGHLLDYRWYDGPTRIGHGVVLDYAPPSPGARQLSLQVADPAGLTNDSPVQAVDVQ